MLFVIISFYNDRYRWPGFICSYFSQSSPDGSMEGLPWKSASPQVEGKNPESSHARLCFLSGLNHNMGL